MFKKEKKPPTLTPVQVTYLLTEKETKCGRKVQARLEAVKYLYKIHYLSFEKCYNIIT